MELATLKPELLLLCLMRVGGFVFVAPVFGSQFLPKVVRLWFSLLLAFALMPVIGKEVELPAFASFAYLLLAAREVLIGLMIGFVCNFFLHGVEFAGHVVGLQMGFASSTLFDPVSRSDVSVVGRFQGLLAIVLFLAMNGHHILLSSFRASYSIVPPAGGALGGGGAHELILATAGIFTVAVRVAMPVLSAIFMVEVGLALLAKTVPQMNIFVVGFPLKISVGLALLGISMPYFGYVLAKAILSTNASLRSVLNAIGGG